MWLVFVVLIMKFDDVAFKLVFFLNLIEVFDISFFSLDSDGSRGGDFLSIV